MSANQLVPIPARSLSWLAHPEVDLRPSAPHPPRDPRNPNEGSSLAVCGADNQLTLWDMALEEDSEAVQMAVGREDLADVPAQLYFVHQGQTNMKEVHWHAQMPGMIFSTAEDGFHMFRPAN